MNIMQTKEERNAAQRERRAANGCWDCKKYEKTKNGFLMRLHRNMRSRVLGIQKEGAHLYAHINKVVPREEFYAWALGSNLFHSLFAAWEASGYDRKLTPSVDRVNAKGEYTFDNMEWVTHSENSRRASIGKTALTPEIVRKVREIYSTRVPHRRDGLIKRAIEESGISWHLVYRALDDDFVTRHKLI